MDIVRKRLTRAEFTSYVWSKDFPTPGPGSIVVHHTWRPTVQNWQGVRSIDGLKRYYEGLGWSAGPHLFVAEDGIWLFTDMSRVGIHAGSANAVWLKNGQKLGGYYHRNATLLSYSIGLEVVGDYDATVWQGETKLNALSCLSTLKKRLNLTNDAIDFHRDFSPKSCPGNAITRQWLEAELAAFDSSNVEEQYRFQFSEAEARRAMELGLLKQIDSETREIVAIGLVRLYDKIKKEWG